MPFNARVIQVLIASPGDVRDERQVVAEVIHEWNSVNARERGVVLMPLRWETDARPAWGLPPQASINSQIVDHADMVIGVFWTRLGTPTTAAASGTVEEIDRAGEAGKPVMLYFSRTPVDPESLDLDEYARLADFKKRTYPRGLVEKYASLEHFRTSLTRHLAMQVRDIIQETAAQSPTSVVEVPNLRLAVLNAKGDALESEVKTTVHRITCVNEDEIPTYVRSVTTTSKQNRMVFFLGEEADPNYYRELVRWYQQAALTATFRLAMINEGTAAVHDMHLDTRFLADMDGSVLAANQPKVPSSTLSTSHGLAAFLVEPAEGRRLENLGRGRWALEEEVGVVQVGRTLAWGPSLHWRVVQPGTLAVTSTVYSSDAPPFVVEARLTVEVNEQEMTYQEILAAMDVTPDVAEA